MVSIRPSESASTTKSWPQRFQRAEPLSWSRSRGLPSRASARTNLVCPGFSPASLDSDARAFATGLRIVLVCAVPTAVASDRKLTLAQNRVQARLKVFLTFTQQLVSLNRQGSFD